MRFAKVLTLAGVMLGGSAVAALADNHGGGVLIHPYKAANYCPTGLQPITIGGVICCGTPNTQAHYIDRAGGRKKVHRKKVRRHAPRYYAVEGEKGVRMR